MKTDTTAPISSADLDEFASLTEKLHALAEETKSVAAKRSEVTRRMSDGRPIREVAEATGLAISRVYYISNDGKGRRRS